jgi:hypothetical protein
MPATATALIVHGRVAAGVERKREIERKREREREREREKDRERERGG